MNTVVKSSRGREENQRKKKGGGIESKRVEQYTPLKYSVLVKEKEHLLKHDDELVQLAGVYNS